MANKIVKLVNLTNHDVVLLNDEAFTQPGVEPTVKLVVKPSGIKAKVLNKTQLVDRILVDGRLIVITSTQYGKVIDLPDPQPGVCYIVSKIVAEAVRGDRDDILIMSGLYRDSSKRVIGCRNLARLYV